MIPTVLDIESTNGESQQNDAYSFFFQVPGIGKVTEKMLRALGIVTCSELYQQRALLSLLFSEASWHNFLEISLGLGSTHLEK